MQRSLWPLDLLVTKGFASKQAGGVLYWELPVRE